MPRRKFSQVGGDQEEYPVINVTEPIPNPLLPLMAAIMASGIIMREKASPENVAERAVAYAKALEERLRA